MSSLAADSESITARIVKSIREDTDVRRGPGSPRLTGGPSPPWNDREAIGSTVEVVVSGAMDAILEGLNLAQREAGTHHPRPFLIPGGAGARKKNLLTPRDAPL